MVVSCSINTPVSFTHFFDLAIAAGGVLVSHGDCHGGKFSLVSSSFSPYVLEQKVNNCDVVLWMCQYGPAGGSAVVSAKPSISFLNLISYKLCGILAP